MLLEVAPEPAYSFSKTNVRHLDSHYSIGWYTPNLENSGTAIIINCNLFSPPASQKKSAEWNNPENILVSAEITQTQYIGLNKKEK